MYPTLRVIILFTLCPAIPGFSFGAYLWLGIFSEHARRFYLLEVIQAFFAATFLATLGAMAFYGIPAFILSVIYVCLKPRKRLKDIALISIAGGLTALMWRHFVPIPSHPAVGFACGFISSFLMSFLALPAQEQASSA
ncbi:hypothetical protein [Rhizobium straminoryzae]|uniref:Uncharacterized protein n=1 Tax=Rhizobium straminoryzae TaxID=1387186 RepID=A0A549T261_9HYPH|nr:hypothetical protein [Rhizobium straminoryzae]TRL35957.1 hypothetical protein FNA46_19045 [Rhizobium straminoryzae]